MLHTIFFKSKQPFLTSLYYSNGCPSLQTNYIDYIESILMLYSSIINCSSNSLYATYLHETVLLHTEVTVYYCLHTLIHRHLALQTDTLWFWLDSSSYCHFWGVLEPPVVTEQRLSIKTLPCLGPVFSKCILQPQPPTSGCLSWSYKLPEKERGLWSCGGAV